MRISVREIAELACAPRVAFDHTNDAASLVSFTGYGPIPGIREAKYITPGPVGVGSRRAVAKLDGTTHLEEITDFVQDRRHATRISGLEGPIALLVRGLEDVWEFDPAGAGTRITRTFVVDARTLAVPVAMLLVPFLRRAMRRDLANTKRAIEKP